MIKERHYKIISFPRTQHIAYPKNAQSKIWVKSPNRTVQKAWDLGLNSKLGSSLQAGSPALQQEQSRGVETDIN